MPLFCIDCGMDLMPFPNARFCPSCGSAKPVAGGAPPAGGGGGGPPMGMGGQGGGGGPPMGMGGQGGGGGPQMNYRQQQAPPPQMNSWPQEAMQQMEPPPDQFQGQGMQPPMGMDYNQPPPQQGGYGGPPPAMPNNGPAPGRLPPTQMWSAPDPALQPGPPAMNQPRVVRPAFVAVSNTVCLVCNKTVYPNDRQSVADKYHYHKFTCFKCSVCNRQLDVMKFSHDKGILYCLNHYKEKFRHRNDFNTVSAVTKKQTDVAPCDVHAPDGTQLSNVGTADPSLTAAVRASPAAPKITSVNPRCYYCGQIAYQMESICVDEGIYYHKRCFKCKVCSQTLSMRSEKYAKHKGVLYCPEHYKQLWNNKVLT